MTCSSQSHGGGNRPRSYAGYEDFMPPSGPPPGTAMNAPPAVNQNAWGLPQNQSHHLNPWQHGQSQAPQRPQSMSSYYYNSDQDQYRPPPNQFAYSQLPPPQGPPPSITGQNQPVPVFRPQTGFTALPHRFHIWNFMKGSTSYLQLSPEFLGNVEYSCKLRGSAKLEVTASSLESVIASANSKSTFSSKSWLMFENHKVLLIPENNYKNYFFDAPTHGGQSEQVEWRKNTSSGLMGKLLGGGSSGGVQPRGWELLTAGASGGSEPLARMLYQGGSMMEKNSHLYIFEWHGRVLRGEMGDIFMVLAIVSALQILHTEYIIKIAKSVGSAG